MRVTIAQLNPVVGDIEGNLRKLKEALTGSANSELLIFSELFLVGYPPRDLLEKSWFIEKTRRALEELLKISEGYPEAGILVGVPMPTGKEGGKALYNSAVLVHRGRIVGKQSKSLLPAYDVFDEVRYFEPASEIAIIPFKGENLGVSICEDAWNDPEFWPKGRMYSLDPVEVLAGKGATIFINISASPFHAGKEMIRYKLISNHARRYGRPFIYANQVGANDELIFDGRSLALDKEGKALAVCPAFQEELVTVETRDPGKEGLYRPQEIIESIHDALVLGIRDYMRKTGFSRAVIGLSGGIDSALTCSLATAAVGPENVVGISMPSPYSSRGSVEDSRRLAANLGIDFKVIPITDIYRSYLDTLGPHFAGRGQDITEENIQARIRGNILMAFSNKFGGLVLSTGNKSELATGYCTLYGDMSGGLSVLSDVPKTKVYELAEFINREREIIPREIIEKAPSAELKPDQKDQDTLPPYPVLDQILHYYIDEGYSTEEIIERGCDPETVKWVVRTVNHNEYKRRQAAPGLKVTTKAFGFGRRMPIAARYQGL